MAVMDQVVVEDSGSDLEQASLLLNRQQRGSARLGLSAGLLAVALCAVGSMTFWPRHSSYAYPQSRAGKLSETIQAYAMQQVGRPLTGEEARALYRRIGQSKQARTRALLRKGHASSQEAGNEVQQDDFKLSDACMGAIQDKLKEAVEMFAQLMIELFFGCVVSGDESRACDKATAKIDGFFDLMVAKCEDEGDFCNISVSGVQQGNKFEESLGMCVPSRCQGEAVEALAAFQEQLDAQLAEAQAAQVGSGADEAEAEETASDEPECSDCTILIKCAATPHDAMHEDGHTQNMMSTKDATHLSK